MTRDELLELKPGRELDALVAEKVMGYITHGQFREKNGVRVMIDRYSTDIAAAWEVVEMFSYIDIHRYDDFFACAIYPIGNSAVMRARGKTMPEAICKAALLAVMGE